jgi:TonB-linked SusC/RagA family outer membrane protein
MKKNTFQVPFGGNLKKFLLKIELTFLILLLSITSSLFAHNGYSQNTTLSIKVKNCTLKKLIEQIENQSEFIFVYYDGAVNFDRKFTVNMTDQTIDKILDNVFALTNNTYKIDDRQITIGRKRTGHNLNISDSEISQSKQSKKITGKVVDKEGLPIPGATIVVKGKTVGTITDNDGNFSLLVPEDSEILLISFVGYVSQEIVITGQTNLNIQMQEATLDVEEVVIVGYGVQKKESVVGAITQIGNDALMKAGTPDVTNAISGKLSGVLTIQQTGEPGDANAEIIIRGLSSWNGSEPLVLVDGVERDFSEMDPNEIATISVLKDASATAVYGAKGANGVIIVTSKRGNLGKPKLSASASTGVQWATAIPKHISSYTTLSMYNVAMMNQQQFTDLISEEALSEYLNPSSEINALRYPDVNWFDEVTNKIAPTVNANISVQGGTNFVKYFTSLGYLYQGSLFDAYHSGVDDARYKYNRYNYRTNLDFALTKTTQLSVNVGGEIGIKNQPSNASWYSLYATSPARFPAYFPAWVLESIPDLDYPDATGMRLSASVGEFTGNPYSSFYDGSFNMYNESKLFTDLILNQKLDFITKGLSVCGKVSLSTYYQSIDRTASYSFPEYTLDYSKIGTSENPWSRTGQTDDIYVMPPLDINVGDLEDNYYKNLYYEMSINYNRTFGNHTVTGLALMNRSRNDYNTSFPYYNEALVGRTTYDYKHKYLLELNMGYTGSERFAPSNRFGFFPSVAIGWTISEEPFFKKAVPWMNKLKFRYSDGLTGSDAADSRWLYISAYSKDSAGNIQEDAAANKNAQWETARKRDFGTEIGLFKNLFTFTVDLFDERREKMLLTPQTVTFLVGNSFKELNLGKLKKHGIEVEAEFNKTTKRGLNYFVRGVFGFNENRIIFKDDPTNTPEYQRSAGKPIGSQNDGVTLSGNGYFSSVDDIHNNASPITLTDLNIGDYKYDDYNADGIIDQYDKHPIKGNLYPPITYSLSSGFIYKGWDFHFMFQGNKGKYVDYNQTFECEFVKGNWSVHNSQLDYWTPTNQDANHATLHYSTGNVSNIAWGGGEAIAGYLTKIEGRFWRNADYIRLKEVYLGYSFSTPSLKERIGVSGISLYATGNNLFTITDLIEGDPERKDFQQGYYPQLSSVILGMKLSF